MSKVMQIMVAAYVLLGIADTDVRQLWTGSFHRSAPDPWTGPVELYIRYRSGDDPPQQIEGTLTWPTLGRAVIRIRGTRSVDGSLEFLEESCLSGDCRQYHQDARHLLTLNKRSLTLSGQASAAFGRGVRGRYTLSQ